MIRETSNALIKYLTQFNHATVEKVSLALNISKKRLWYEISILNEALERLNGDLITLNQGSIEVPNSFESNQEILIKFLETKELIPATHRSYAIAVYVSMRQDWVSLKHLENLLNLSKNSVLSELKLFRELASDYDVELLNNRKDGYYFEGSEEAIRKLCELSMSHLTSVDYGLGIIKDIFAMWDLDYNRDYIEDIVEKSASQYNVNLWLNDMMISSTR